MKRNFVLLGVLIAASILVFVLWKTKEDPSTTIERTASNFRIENIGLIHRIEITHKSGMRSELIRKDDHWLISSQGNGQHRARQSSVDHLLRGIRNQQLDHIPTKAATENILRSINESGIHVEIWDQAGNKLLGYWVGGVTQDERATYFLKEDTDQPYALMVPGFEGSLRQRYELRPVDWRDVRFWTEENEKIDTLKVHYPKQRQHSFVIARSEKGYEVTPMFSTTPRKTGDPTIRVNSYFTVLNKLACENFLTGSPEKDSIIQSLPFMEMDLIYPDKKSYVNFFSAGSAIQETSTDIQRLYIDYNGSDFMIAQYNVIKGAFVSYGYFFE